MRLGINGIGMGNVCPVNRGSLNPWKGIMSVGSVQKIIGRMKVLRGVWSVVMGLVRYRVLWIVRVNLDYSYPTTRLNVSHVLKTHINQHSVTRLLAYPAVRVLFRLLTRLIVYAIKDGISLGWSVCVVDRGVLKSRLGMIRVV